MGLLVFKRLNNFIQLFLNIWTTLIIYEIEFSCCCFSLSFLSTGFQVSVDDQSEPTNINENKNEPLRIFSFKLQLLQKLDKRKIHPLYDHLMDKVNKKTWTIMPSFIFTKISATKSSWHTNKQATSNCFDYLMNTIQINKAHYD